MDFKTNVNAYVSTGTIDIRVGSECGSEAESHDARMPLLNSLRFNKLDHMTGVRSSSNTAWRSIISFARSVPSK